MMTALYTGTSGLRSHSVGMSTISNNIANLNTVGFKNSMLLYSENISSAVNSAPANGVTERSQLGLGVSVGVNRTMFQQGAFMQGSSPTDLAISGKGFFGVEKDGLTQYTRAGNFRFTKEGALIDPNGFGLLGYKVTNGSVAAQTSPIMLDFSVNGQGYMPPKATDNVTVIENLGSRESLQNDATNPFFSLASAWNAANSPPLSSGQYGHKSSVPVYDSKGQSQNLDIYYDYVGSFGGKHVYQYVIGSDASSSGGPFAAGTMTFSSYGEMQDMTMFTAPGGTANADLAAWKPASFGPGGNPQFTADFGGGAQTMSINFGIEMNGTWNGGYANAAAVNANPAGVYDNAPRRISAAHSTCYEGASGTVNSRQDGYAPGFLQSMTITPDGMMVGRYNNGENMDLYQIPIYRFTSEEGLRHEGGNRYSATTESGAAEVGLPGTENYGTLHEASLEQSTVDLATEFATMIVTQRGFQMNSKVITTSDQMLQKALELKR